MKEQLNNGISRRSFVVGGTAALALAGIGLSGCGGGSDSGSGTSTDAAGGDTSASAGALAAAVAYDGSDYTPASTSQALPLAGNRHVTEGLYDLDLSDYSAYAALADGDPVAVSDTEYEITIRDGAKYSDGTDVVAGDVVEAYARATVEGGMYLPMLSFISSVEAKDDKTVSIKTAYPFSLIKERLSLIRVTPASMTNDELKVHPVGSGPWVYDEITETKLTFSPNPNYNGPFVPKDTSMVWDVIKDDTARTTAMTEATVQVMENVPADIIPQIQAVGATVDDVQGFSLPFLMFNTKKAPLDDNRVRQAFFYAIDVEKLINNALSGQAATVKCFLPENHANFHEAATVFTYDPEKAKSLLSEAGVDSLSITLDTTDASWITALSPSIKEDLAAVGIEATIRESVSAALYSNYCDTDNPEFDVVLAPGDPSVFGNDPDLLMSWWYGDNSWTQKRTQWKGSEAYEELHGYMQAAVEASGSEQQENWNKCFDLLAEQVPLYPLLHRKVSTGYYEDRLDGFKAIGTTGVSFIGVSSK